jgi:isocitrate/isopropylmalate dehydrogenase
MKKIAVLAGDGIAPEVMQEVKKVLNAVRLKFNLEIDWQDGDVGGYAIDQHGTALPEKTLSLCDQSDAFYSVPWEVPNGKSFRLKNNPKEALCFHCASITNLFGDIISDQCAMLTGSMGLLASASIDEEKFGLYEPAGGSAPDMAGQGIANPIAQILSAAMLLRYSFNYNKAAEAIEQAVSETLAASTFTPDIAVNKKNAINTSEMGDAIVERIK